MPQVKNFEELTLLFQQKPRQTVAFVCPDDDHTAYVACRCVEQQLADVILVSHRQPSEAIHRLLTQYPSHASFIKADDIDDACRRGVAVVRSGQAAVLMKGSVNTDNLLHAALNKECGLLRPGQVMSHLTAAEVPDFDRLIMFSDAAVIPKPTLPQFEAMIGYDIDIARKLSIEAPRVALIHFTEKINEKFPCTIDYLELKRLAAEGRWGEAIVDGPMDAKTACDAHSAQIKGIQSAINGQADILIFPDLEAGNTFYKCISLFGRATMAGIITGADAPIVVPSRSDSAESKFFSLALACIAGTEP